MDIVFCANGMDHGVAVGVGHWQGRRGTENPHPRRPATLCRPCLVKLVDADLVRVEVTTPAEAAIACIRTGEDITTGGTAWLDPAQTNIAALVYAGYVKVLPPDAKPAKAEGSKG